MGFGRRAEYGIYLRSPRAIFGMSAYVLHARYIPQNISFLIYFETTSVGSENKRKRERERRTARKRRCRKRLLLGYTLLIFHSLFVRE